MERYPAYDEYDRRPRTAYAYRPDPVIPRGQPEAMPVMEPPKIGDMIAQQGNLAFNQPQIAFANLVPFDVNQVAILPVAAQEMVIYSRPTVIEAVPAAQRYQRMMVAYGLARRIFDDDTEGVHAAMAVFWTFCPDIIPRPSVLEEHANIQPTFVVGPAWLAILNDALDPDALHAHDVYEWGDIRGGVPHAGNAPVVADPMADVLIDKNHRTSRLWFTDATDRVGTVPVRFALTQAAEVSPKHVRRAGMMCLLTAVGKMGSITNNKFKKVKDGVTEMGLNVVKNDLIRVWNIVRPYFLDDTDGRTRVGRLMLGIGAALGEPRSIGLENVGLFSRASGFSAFSLIAGAILAVPDFPWTLFIEGLGQVPTHISINADGTRKVVAAPGAGQAIVTSQGAKAITDMILPNVLVPLRIEGGVFIAGVNRMRDTPYAGYVTAAGQGRKVGNIVFLAKNLMARALNNQSTAEYGGGATGTSMSGAIEKWVTLYIEATKSVSPGQIVLATAPEGAINVVLNNLVGAG